MSAQPTQNNNTQNTYTEFFPVGDLHTWDGDDDAPPTSTYIIPTTQLAKYAPYFTRPPGTHLDSATLFVKPAVVSAFALWLCKREAEDAGAIGHWEWDDLSELESLRGREREKKWTDIVNLCVNIFWFAQAGHIKDLCLDAMARLIACFEVAGGEGRAHMVNWRVAMDVVPHAYENTEKNSPLRRILVAGFAKASDAGDIENTTMPHEYRMDLEEYLQMKPRPAGRMALPCEDHLHQHNTNEQEMLCSQYKTYLYWE